MKVTILSVFPALYEQFLHTSLVHRAQERGVVSISTDSFFSYVQPKERIDAPTAGHGAGMLIRPDVVEAAIEDKQAQSGSAFKIFFSPHGKKLDQSLLQELAAKLKDMPHVMLIAGRYEGMDARVETIYADEIISLGDFVLMGGDLPAMVLLEGLLRLFPGVVGKQESVEEESFSGPFVDYPEFTAPVVWKGLEVPAIVRSGNHAQLRAWRTRQAAERTLLSHTDWLRSYPLTDDDKALVQELVPSHYAVLMHSQVFVGRTERIPGTTSVTSLDIHDIARSCATYGLKHYFLVTPLLDQQAVVTTLLDFWQKGVGVDYNKNRHEAVKHVSVKDNFEEVLAAIEAREGVKPLVVATSAREVGQDKRITFHDQGVVWAQKRPILFVFGTGQGLVPEFINGCDYVLPPVGGLTNFRHLSVRSAVAVVLDRWLGLSARKIGSPVQGIK